MKNKLYGGNVMNAITEMIISAIVKKGVLHECRNFNTEIEIPMTVEDSEHKVRIKINCEHMTLRFENDKKIEA